MSAPYRLENELYRIDVEADAGRLVSVLDKKGGCDLITDPALAENFRLLLPLPDVECNYIDGREQKLSACDASADSLTLTWRGPLTSGYGAFDLDVVLRIALAGEAIEFTCEVRNDAEMTMMARLACWRTECPIEQEDAMVGNVLLCVALAVCCGCSLMSDASVEPRAQPQTGARKLTLVDDGLKRAAIIVAVGDEHAREAAEALQKYIEKMSGAKLDILEEGQEGAGQGPEVRIYVGHTAAAKENGITVPAGHDPSIRPDAFEEEGYILKTRGNNIFIGGNADGPYLGTIYGAYAFLEKLGCRFYFPGEWGEVVPEHKTVTVPDLDVESSPDFPLRHIGLNGGWVPTTAEEQDTYRDWRKKVGYESKDVGTYPLVGDGFLGILLPPSEFWEAHPEYYAMDKKGQRHIGTGDVNHTTMLCLSNPDVFTQVLQNLKTAFAEKPVSGFRNLLTSSSRGIRSGSRDSFSTPSRN